VDEVERMTAVAYRIYDLPWTPSEADQRRVRRVLGAALGIFIGLGIVIPLLPERPRTIATAPPVPERVVEFLLERPKPPPPKPPPVVEVPRPQPQEEPVPQVERRQTVPAPVAEAPPQPDARRKAAASGLLALSDQLAELRELDVQSDRATQSLDNAAGERVQVDRAILTARTGEGSGGIAVAESSRGFGGGGAGKLAGHQTAKVESSAAAAPAEAKRTGRSSQASRTREEVELVFDRNKSAIYSIYARALRDNPSLAGKVVLEVTIAPSGDVTECRIVSSDLGDAELERKLVARVKMFRFEARDVAPMTTTKPIEFFPA
jgi:TonB family protein